MIEKISIVIPVYNVEKYLMRCLESVLAQTYENIEVILINDGSTDSSGVLCDRFKENHPNTIVIHKENEGLGLTRNVGMDLAQGNFIMFLDSDDYIQPNHISELYKEIVRQNADAIYCGYTIVKKDKETIMTNSLAGKNYAEEEIRYEVIPRICGQTGSLNDNIQMSSCMAMYRLETIKRSNIRFLSERKYVSEDLLFNLDFLQAAKRICFSDVVSYMYYFNECSLSHRYLADRFEKSKLMMHEVTKRTKELNVYNLCVQRIKNQFIISTRVCIQGEQSVWRSIGLKSSLKNIKTIINDEDVKDVLKELDDRSIRFQAKIINSMIKGNHYLVLWIMMFIRNKLHI